MNYSIFRFTLNMHTHRAQVSIPSMRGDTAVRLLITLSDGGNTYTIEDGCTVILTGKKPDGNAFVNGCAVLNNATIQYDFTGQTATCSGLVECELSVYGKDGGLVTSARFAIVVGDRVLSSYDEESVLETTGLDHIISSEEGRVKAETARKSSEVARVKAETARVAAEADRGQSIVEIKRSLSLAEEEIDFVKDRLGLLIADRTANGIGSSWSVPSNALAYASIAKLGGLSRTVQGAIVNLVNCNHPKQLWGAEVESLGNNQYRFCGVTIDVLGDNRYRFSGTCNQEWQSFLLGLESVFEVNDGDTWYTSVELISGSASAGETYVTPHWNGHGNNWFYFSDTIGDVSSGSTVGKDSEYSDEKWSYELSALEIGLGNGATFNDAVYEFRCGKEMGVGGVVPSIITSIKSGSTTVEIPDEVLAFPDYGHGINLDCCNYIDVERGIYVRNCEFSNGSVVQVATTTQFLPIEFLALITEPIAVTAGSTVSFNGGTARYEIDYQVKL